MPLSLPTFAAGSKVRASQLGQLVAGLQALTPLSVIKPTDESVISSTTLQNDDALFLPIAANTAYWLDLELLGTETTGQGADIKVAWAMPSGCRIDAAAFGPHVNWTGAAAAVEVEFNSWANATSSPTGAITWGMVSGGVVFGYHVRGVVRNGANAGTLQLQWAQNASVAENVTVKAGSALTLTQLP